MICKMFDYPENYQGNRFPRRYNTSAELSNDKAFRQNVYVKLNTIDKFQGQEADLVFLSMVQNKRVGFMDSPNRLNVAITRARFQLVIVGNKNFFASEQKDSEELKKLATQTIDFQAK